MFYIFLIDAGKALNHPYIKSPRYPRFLEFIGIVLFPNPLPLRRIHEIIICLNAIPKLDPGYVSRYVSLGRPVRF
jgi:hypothetical protein